jgi:hypothetical protein
MLKRNSTTTKSDDVCCAANANCGATNHLSAIKLVPQSSVVEKEVERMNKYTLMCLSRSPGDVFAKVPLSTKKTRVQNDHVAQSFFDFCTACAWDLQIWIVGFAQARANFAVAFLLGWLSKIISWTF